MSLLQTWSRNYFKLKSKNQSPPEKYKLKDEENMDLRDDHLLNVEHNSLN